VSGWTGGDVLPAAHCVLAPNPGPMTLDGTNTWVLGAPDAARVVVVDPGPEHPGHLHAVLAAVEARGARVGVVLLTHGHLDHSEAARSFARAAGGVGVRALDPAQRLGDEGLGDGDVVDVDGLLVEVMATPGHTGDSLSFILPDSGALLTGDTVLGRGTTVVAYPDGRLGDYLDSLARLEELVATRGLVHLLPGHGPALPDPLGVVRFYRRHRAERLDQVRAAVAAGARTPRDVVERVYADVPREVWPAAELSVRAQLEYLQTLR
jgi:glyoxylase-like metal-dependent hydrolase (beta-lactamase superfamily II)